MSFRDANYSNWLETPQRKPLVRRVLAWTYAAAAMSLMYVVLIEGAPK